MFDLCSLKMKTRLLFVIFVLGLFSQTRGNPLNITDIPSDDPLMPVPLENDDDIGMNDSIDSMSDSDEVVEMLGEQLPSDLDDIVLMPTETEKEPPILEILNSSKNNISEMENANDQSDGTKPSGNNPNMFKVIHLNKINNMTNDINESMISDDNPEMNDSSTSDAHITENINENTTTDDNPEMSDPSTSDAHITENINENTTTDDNPEVNDPSASDARITENINENTTTDDNPEVNDPSASDAPITEDINEDMITDDNPEVNDLSASDTQISSLELDSQEQLDSVESLEIGSFKGPSPQEINDEIIPETLPVSEPTLDSIDPISSRLTDKLILNKTDDKSFLADHFNDKVELLTQGVAASIEIQFNNEQGIFNEVEVNELEVTESSTNSITSIGGQCPPVTKKNSSEECQNAAPSTCWTPGSQDVDCFEKGDICCNDGCGNYCLDEVVCKKVLVNETQIIDKEVEMCSDVPSEVCREISVEKCEKNCKTIIESIEALEDVEECHLEKDEVCKEELTTICKDEEIPLVEEVESCENLTKTDCDESIVNCSIVQTQSCQLILQKIPKNVVKEECRDVAQPPKCEIEVKEKCHLKLVPIKTTKPKEICTNETMEVCVDKTIEKSKNICVEKPKKTCRIENIPKKVIKKVKKCKIQNFQKCQMVYKEVCGFDSYKDYNCKKVPQTVCREVPKKKCEFEKIQEEKIVPQKVCRTEYLNDCHLINVPTVVIDCKNITKPYCRTESIEVVEEVSKEVCVDEEVEECSEQPLKKECKASIVTIFDDVEEEVCTESPEEVCDEKPSCKAYTEEVCTLKPIVTTETRHVCTEEEMPKCKLVEAEVCETIKRPTVKHVERDLCKDVCKDKPETHCDIKMEKQCKTVFVPKEVVVLVVKCE